jgi:beta-glucosidase
MKHRWTLANVLLHAALLGLLLAGCTTQKLTCAQVADQLAVSTNTAIQPTPRASVDWWMPRHEAVVQQAQKGNAGVIFIGDSITHGWEKQSALWESSFGRWNPINAGFSGDRTQHVLWRLDNGEIDGIQPRVAVLMIGTNNSNGDEYTAEQIAEGVEAIVCRLRTKLPQTKVLILSIFPRGTKEQRDDKTGNASFNPQWAKNDLASKLVSQMADGKWIYYLDINKAFLDESGVLTRDVMPDLLHPNEKGYQIWADVVLPTLEKLMAD